MFFKHNLLKKQGFCGLIIDFLSSNCNFKKSVGTAFHRTLNPLRDAMLERKKLRLPTLKTLFMQNTDHYTTHQTLIRSRQQVI